MPSRLLDDWPEAEVSSKNSSQRPGTSERFKALKKELAAQGKGHGGRCGLLVLRKKWVSLLLGRTRKADHCLRLGIGP